MLSNDFEHVDVANFIENQNLENLFCNESFDVMDFLNCFTLNLSGGEKQKIALLESILKNPSLLILDEPTSAMDSTSVNGLKEFLVNYKKNRIIIIISHDKRLNEIADFTMLLNPERKSI